MRALFSSLAALGLWVVPITSLLFAFYAWNIAYGVFQGPPDEVSRASNLNLYIVVGFLGIQFLFSAVKGKINVGLFLLDLLTSGIGVFVTLFILLDDGATLSPYEAQIMGVFFAATAIDTIVGAINDGNRMILTDEAKIIS